MASRFIVLALATTFFCFFLTHSKSEASIERSKFAGKIIETTSGDIYDCVDFYKQPAFNHPLLKNHSFHPKMRPSSRPERSGTTNRFSKHGSDEISVDHIKFKDGGCPLGTVPIRRINNDDPVQTQLPRQYDPTFGMSSSSNNNSESITYLALAQPKGGDPKNVYHGVGASITIYNPQVKPSQYSSGEIILRGGTDAIMVGWTVNPNVYKDNQTRAFIYTVARDQHCFNSQCGFISVRQDYPLDYVLPTSTLGKQSVIEDIFIFQDQENGNWWLEFGKKDPDVIGFWPQQIFGGLHDSATYFACGGEAYTSSTDFGQPQMGTGYKPFSDEDLYNSYCRDIVVVDEAHKVVWAEHMDTFSNDRNFVAQAGPMNFFYYGGPNVYN